MAGILVVNAFNLVAAGKTRRQRRTAEPDVFYFPVVFHNFISLETFGFADSRTHSAA
jgi:hypothetical protein